VLFPYVVSIRPEKNRASNERTQGVDRRCPTRTSHGAYRNPPVIYKCLRSFLTLDDDHRFVRLAFYVVDPIQREVSRPSASKPWAAIGLLPRKRLSPSSVVTSNVDSHKFSVDVSDIVMYMLRALWSPQWPSFTPKAVSLESINHVLLATTSVASDQHFSVPLGDRQ
jgi:hypothetical protein